VTDEGRDVVTETKSGSITEPDTTIGPDANDLPRTIGARFVSHDKQATSRFVERMNGSVLDIEEIVPPLVGASELPANVRKLRPSSFSAVRNHTRSVCSESQFLYFRNLLRVGMAGACTFSRFDKPSRVENAHVEQPRVLPVRIHSSHRRLGDIRSEAEVSH
jgi:hypothetical protein